VATTQYENVIIVTRKTELDDLVARFNTKAQARFYLQQAGQPFDSIEAAHDKHQQVLKRVRQAIPKTLKSQLIDRDMVPRYTFGDADLVITVGQDGLVSNTAKYLAGQPILAVNPDPQHFDGILLPFTADTLEEPLHNTLYGELVAKKVTLAKAQLRNGQSLLAFNDFFIGARSHVSARYTIGIGEREETQSSSGIIVSTGAGSTGWLQSVYAGAAGVVEALGGKVVPPPHGGRLKWGSEKLIYSVREPFPSIATQATIVHGGFTNETPLKVTSHMASNGVIFSDGVEADYLEFNAGSELILSTAPQKALLVVPSAVLQKKARRGRRAA
jgi:NAD kinase